MDTSVMKLKQLLQSRYGKVFELRPMMDLTKLDSSQDSVVCGNDLYIPIRVKEQFLGAAVIPHGWEFSEEVRKNIAQLIRMVLEPKLYNEFLSRKESNLLCLETLSFPETNLTLFGDDEPARNLAAEFFAKPSLLTSLIHLQGENMHLIKKLALQIHETTNRWAFVPFEDVVKDVKDVMDLCNLGGLTLFIESVETLSMAHQDLLAQYLNSPRSAQEPLIITSTTWPMNELKSCIENQFLLQDMLNVHLEVDKTPLNPTLVREMIDLLLNPDSVQDLH